MIVSQISFKVHPKNRADAVKTIRAVIGPTRVKPGCTKCVLYADVENDDDVLFIEEWSSHEHFEKHIRSDQYLLVLKTLELAIQDPDVKFHTVSKTANLELVENIR